VFEYFHNLLDQGAHFSGGDPIVDHDVDAWVAGGGVSYTMDAWTLGAQYAHQDAEDDGDGADFTMDRAIVTGNYALGPGYPYRCRSGVYVDRHVARSVR